MCKLLAQDFLREECFISFSSQFSAFSVAGEEKMCIFLALSPSFKNLFSTPFKFFSPYFFSLLSSVLRLGKDIWRDKKDMKEGILDGRQKNILY